MRCKRGVGQVRPAVSTTHSPTDGPGKRLFLSMHGGLMLAVLDFSNRNFCSVQQHVSVWSMERCDCFSMKFPGSTIQGITKTLSGHSGDLKSHNSNPSPPPYYLESGSMLSIVNQKLALAKSLCQQLNSNSICHLPLRRLKPVLPLLLNTY